MPWLLVLRVAALLGLAASAALLSDYTADAPSFCSAASGCGAVRASTYSALRLSDGGIVPLPLFGVVGFAASLGLSLWSRRLASAAAAIGAMVGAWLIYVQAVVLGQFCWLCLGADGAALVGGAAAIAVFRASAGEEELADRLPRWSWVALATLALAAPLAWPQLKASPPVPAGVLAYYRPGKLNVVEFADFQCPACRRYHELLEPVLKRYGERVHFVRLNKPLAGHRFAMDAARASVCGEKQGKREPMADALFGAGDLSPPGIDRVARTVGLEPKAFESCMLDPATNARVMRESALLAPPDLEGLPTTYIGGKRLVGVQSAEAVEDALERASRGEGNRGLSGFAYAPLVLFAALLIVRLGLRKE